MGHSNSKKMNKAHDKQKMFRVGISVGRNELSLEGYLQMGFFTKTIENYSLIENNKLVEDDKLVENDKFVENDISDNDELVASIQNDQE